VRSSILALAFASVPIANAQRVRTSARCGSVTDLPVEEVPLGTAADSTHTGRSKTLVGYLSLTIAVEARKRTVIPAASLVMETARRARRPPQFDQVRRRYE
jgi:hypothetical protein